MNRAAAFQTTVCTIAVGAISAGTSTFVMAATQGSLGFMPALAGLSSIAVGSWLVYLGHCRAMLPRGPA